jgi:hypothetical protein
MSTRQKLPPLALLQHTPQSPGVARARSSTHTTATAAGGVNFSSAMPKLPATASSPLAVARTWSTRAPSFTMPITLLLLLLLLPPGTPTSSSVALEEELAPSSSVVGAAGKPAARPLPAMATRVGPRMATPLAAKGCWGAPR